MKINFRLFDDRGNGIVEQEANAELQLTERGEPVIKAVLSYEAHDPTIITLVEIDIGNWTGTKDVGRREVGAGDSLLVTYTVEFTPMGFKRKEGTR